MLSAGAARDAVCGQAWERTDAGMFACFPEMNRIPEWMRIYLGVELANGTESDARRTLVSWALEACFERCTAGGWSV